MGQVNCEKKLALAWSRNSLRTLPVCRAALGSAGAQTSAYHLWAQYLLARRVSWEEYVQKLLSQGARELSLALYVYLPADWQPRKQELHQSAQVHRVASLLELAGSSLSTITSVLRTVCQVSDPTLQVGSR